MFLDDDADVQARIVREVFERVLWADTSTVQVSVTDGVVILRGRLHRRSEVTLAARLAAAQDGVVAVDNELTYDTDDTVHDTLVTPGW